MLTCHSCIKRCLQTIIGRPAPFASLSSSSTARISRRAFASNTYSESGHQKSSSPQRDDKVWTIAKPSSHLPHSRFEQNRQEWLKSRGTRPPSKALKRRPNLDTESAMQKHFQYLQDPLKLSEYIRRTLRNDDFETAEKVVQYASKTLQCVVSWNHLVDWQLSKGRMNGAIKTFNEVWRVVPRVRPRADLKTDEKTSPSPRCAHIHNHFQRMRRTQRCASSTRKSPHNLSLHVHRQMSCQAKYNPR